MNPNYALVNSNEELAKGVYLYGDFTDYANKDYIVLYKDPEFTDGVTAAELKEFFTLGILIVANNFMDGAKDNIYIPTAYLGNEEISSVSVASFDTIMFTSIEILSIESEVG